VISPAFVHIFSKSVLEMFRTLERMKMFSQSNNKWLKAEKLSAE